jgi:hypothetical protein
MAAYIGGPEMSGIARKVGPIGAWHDLEREIEAEIGRLE